MGLQVGSCDEGFLYPWCLPTGPWGSAVQCEGLIWWPLDT